MFQPRFMDHEEAQDLLRRMCLADERIEEKARRVKVLAETMKIAKGELEEALEYRQRLSDEIRNPKPFFETSLQQNTREAGQLSIEDLAEWDATDLSDCGLPNALLETLERAGITTVGHVRQLTEARRSLREIKGVGDELAARVADAIAEKWLEFRSDMDAAAFMAAQSVEREIANETDEDLSDAGLARVLACNKCNAYREPNFHPCPACQGPEYRIVAVPNDVPRATAPAATKKTRKRTAKAGD